MKATPLAISDVLLLEPIVFGDERGFFLESFNRRVLASVGIDVDFVQDNHSKSQQGVLRGLHFQIKHPQGKLIRVTAGEIFDVAVDLRPNSPTFGQHVTAVLNAEKHQQLWIPPGFAHGFYTMSPNVEVLYKTTDYWYPEFERSLLWDDSDLGIAWPLSGTPLLAKKDAVGLSMSEYISSYAKPVQR
jgi:dTDP-4-dehydrorhamnose 3,5-epimerase